MKYNIQEVAERLSTSIKVIRRLVASGELRAIKKSGAYTISEEDLQVYLNRAGQQDNFLDLFNSSVTYSPKPPTWVDIADMWHSPSKSPYTFVDLFCGAGGLSKGLEWAGFEGICGLDWFKEAGETYAHNFHHPFVYGDISKSETKEHFKIKYTIGEATEDTINRRAKPRHIYIDDIELYCLEEIDFSEGHMQDNRMWSNNSSRCNGRLQISAAFRREHQMDVERISYQETCRMIQNMMEE